MTDLKIRFGRTYVDLPISIRSDVAVVIGDTAYSWNVLKIEVDNNTKIGEEGLKILDKLGFLKK